MTENVQNGGEGSQCPSDPLVIPQKKRLEKMIPKMYSIDMLQKAKI